MKMLLLAIYVLVSAGKDTYKPVKGATIACAEVPTPGEDGEDDGEDTHGYDWAPTDSRGHIVFEGPVGTYHCSVRAPGYIFRTMTLTFTETHREELVVVKKN